MHGGSCEPRLVAIRLVSALNGLHAASHCRNADVEEQIGHLRAQLLRSEQDNELMRIKLEQETAEREKAQKQVCSGCQVCAGCFVVVCMYYEPIQYSIRNA